MAKPIEPTPILEGKDAEINKFILFTGDIKLINALKYELIKTYLKDMGLEIGTIELKQSIGIA